MAKRRTLEEMVDDTGYPPEVGNAVIADVDHNKTRERIESGELTLPSHSDAAVWHARTTGKAQQTPTEKAQTDTIADLKRRLDALESEKGHGEV